MNLVYAALLTALIGLGWLFERTAHPFCYQGLDGRVHELVDVYSSGSNDDLVFSFGKYLFGGLLLVRLLWWRKRPGRVELALALLVWSYVGLWLGSKDVGSIVVTIRMGNWLVTAWSFCYLALAPAVFMARHVREEMAKR